MQYESYFGEAEQIEFCNDTKILTEADFKF